MPIRDSLNELPGALWISILLGITSFSISQTCLPWSDLWVLQRYHTKGADTPLPKVCSGTGPLPLFRKPWFPGIFRHFLGGDFWDSQIAVSREDEVDMLGSGDQCPFQEKRKCPNVLSGFLVMCWVHRGRSDTAANANANSDAPENSLANCGNQVPKKKLRIKRCEGIR